jgi:hypothetical protein
MATDVKRQSLKVYMRRQSLMERLAIVVLAGTASIVWLVATVFVPLAIA